MSANLLNDIKLASQKEALRIEESCTYSSKSHFNSESTWVKNNYWLGIPATVLTAAAGAALIKTQPDLASALTLLASLLTGLMTFLKPIERASSHRDAAVKFQALQNDARVFREIQIFSITEVEKVSAFIKVLSDRRNELNQKSPAISLAAFKKAKKGIAEGEAIYAIDTAKKI